jgi:aminoglycoside phosphotransferase (APT) family kinase protein
VTDASGWRWALRRPPLGRRLGSAHDMAREHRVVSALGPTEVPVAPVVGLCEDESVNEAPFYVMEFVEGPILRGLAEAEAFPDHADRRAIGERVADTLVSIHAVDPDAAGLAELGRKQDYVERQLRRWQGQWEKSKTRELPEIDAVHARLAARIPEQGPATIVHGDYRLDNMILSPSGEVAAVVDWELCTLGDPLADVGLLMAYWPQRGEETIALGQPANLAPGFPTREELSDRYAQRSGRDLSQLDFFLALGYWKLAIILEGVYARYAAGQYGEVDPGIEHFARLVERLAQAADEAERRD